MCVFLWWSSLKPPASNQRSGKHSCSKTKMGANVTTPIPCLGVSGVSLKYERHKLQQNWEIFTLFIDRRDASYVRQLRALEIFEPDLHPALTPVYLGHCQVGWISGRFSSSFSQQLLEKGLYQKSVLLKSRLWVWASDWLLPRHSVSSISDGP